MNKSYASFYIFMYIIEVRVMLFVLGCNQEAHLIFLFNLILNIIFLKWISHGTCHEGISTITKNNQGCGARGDP